MRGERGISVSYFPYNYSVTMASSGPSGDVDKLRDGPCGHYYKLLMACSDRKDAVYGKRTMEACPDETDLLLKCVHKNPLYFLKNPTKEQREVAGW